MDTIDAFAGEFRFLSNFHPVPVLWRGELYPTAEHTYQASKTDDARWHAEIAEAAGPAEAKRLGKLCPMRPGFESIKVLLMYDIVLQKFKQNHFLIPKLLNTGSAELVEGNAWGDVFWGVSGGKGENWLGKILMAVREHFHKEVRFGSRQLGEDARRAARERRRRT